MTAQTDPTSAVKMALEDVINKPMCDLAMGIAILREMATAAEEGLIYDNFADRVAWIATQIRRCYDDVDDKLTDAANLLGAV